MVQGDRNHEGTRIGANAGVQGDMVHGIRGEGRDAWIQGPGGRNRREVAGIAEPLNQGQVLVQV